MPDYDDLINKIQLIHGDKQEDDYLYKKDVYVEETAITNDNNVPTETAQEDFDLPDLEEEEIPDFLKALCSSHRIFQIC